MNATLLLLATGASLARPMQALHIPQLLKGDNFKLSLNASRHSFWKGATTATYSYSAEPFWGPTLELVRGHNVAITIQNNLAEPTTSHWHGLHLPAKEDGGPHQLIAPHGTWTASFKVDNNAATYWYHPHPHEATQKQLTMGAGGFIIVRDSNEAKLDLPRTYGVDDIPLVLTSRRFTKQNEFSSRGDNDKYGDYLLTNGTLDAQTTLPRGWVRLRILNAEIERGYNLGLSNGAPLYMVATDGGLVQKPVRLSKLRLMPGERAEVLIDLRNAGQGQTFDLVSYNSNQEFGFPGAEPGRYAPNGSYLNNIDFRVLHINVGESAGAVQSNLPAKLADLHLFKAGDAKVSRTVSINGGGPPDKEFQFGGKYFDHDRVDQVVKLGDIEKWTVTNDEVFGHSFHIHDVQFSLLERDGAAVGEDERGWKDTVYITRGGSATFVAKFDDFASDRYPFMYHCHMSNHEDGGLMGQFLVVKDPASVRKDAKGFPTLAHLIGEAPQEPKISRQSGAPDLASVAAGKPMLVFFIGADCPCSQDAAKFVEAIALGAQGRLKVLGVVDGDLASTRKWAKRVMPRFELLSDSRMRVIRHFRAKASTAMALVGSDGKVAKTYPGYCRAWFRQLASTVDRLTGCSTPAHAFDAAPVAARSGCAFGAG